MTQATIQFTVSLAIAEGKFDAFEAMVKTMAARTQQEPGALTYEFFLSADRKRCRLIEIYADAAAVLAHLNGPTVRELVPKMFELASVTCFEIYGDPGAEAAKILTGHGFEIFAPWRGFHR